MQLIEATKIRINNLLEQNNMTVWDLYKLTGIPKQTISSLLTGVNKDVKQSTILHICEGFNISLKEFYNDKLFENVEDEK